MNPAGFSLLLSFAALAVASPVKRGVTTALMNEFDLYTRFASAAYWDTCPKPVDSELVELVRKFSIYPHFMQPNVHPCAVQ